MKLVHMTVHFEYGEAITRLLEEQGVCDYVLYPMIEGRDFEGRHEGTQVFPGNFTAIHAQVEDERVEALLAELKVFREEKRAHKHLQAVVLPIERRL